MTQTSLASNLDINTKINKSLDKIKPTDQERDQDTGVARSTILDGINKTTEAIDDLIDIARQSQHPRAYEVLGKFLEIRSKQTHDLIDVHIKRDKLSGNKEVGPEGTVTNQQINVFVGDTNALLRSIKEIEGKTVMDVPFADVTPPEELKALTAPPPEIAETFEVKENPESQENKDQDESDSNHF